MSARKHRKRLEAYAYLRGLLQWRYPAVIISRPLTRVQRYCIDRGMARLTRERRGPRTIRTLFDPS